MTKIMGILNVTPDSFSDGGRFVDVEQALAHAKRLVEEGADAIDVGGESTRPGAETVSAEEEIARVVPIIARLAAEISVPISIDTYKPEVAKAAIEAGASIINDVWGSTWGDGSMVNVAATYGVPIILMHNREEAVYENFVSDVLNDLREAIDRALAAGVKPEQVWIDPGIGFAKTYEQNLEMMRQLEHVSALGHPVVLGTSRKSMIGLTLDLPPEERVEGTIATTCLGITKGCHWVRVHDVQANKRAAKMMDAMLGELNYG